MINRWTILAVLFLARFAMAVQFQSVAALTPGITGAYGIGLAEIGLLIGLYLAPGIVVAGPGGALSARIGDKRFICLGLALMIAGDLLTLLAPDYGAFLAGRVIAGAGGVILNVILTKLLVDWFAGREIATAMGIFVTSWPAGIAFALAVLPPLADLGGLALARAGVLGLTALAFALFAAIYRAPDARAEAARAAPAATAAFPVVALGAASLVWALYNSALSMIFSFGAAALGGAGWTGEAAVGMIGAFMAAFTLAVPLGGILADRTGRGTAIIALTLAGYLALVPLALALPAPGATAVLLGLAVLFALPAGPIMALPSEVLPPAARALGMGIFFTIYYLAMMAAPAVAGRLAEATGSTAAPLHLGMGLAGAALAALALFRKSAPAPSRG